jgi:hypothetical protein
MKTAEYRKPEASSVTRKAGLFQSPAWQDAALCLSFANVSFFRIWEETLDYRPTETIGMTHIPSPADYWAAMSAVLLVATLLFAGLRFSRNRLDAGSFRFVRFSSFALLAIPANGFRVGLSPYSKYFRSPLLEWLGPRTLLFVVAPILAAVVWCLWKWQEPIWKGLTKVFLALLPLCVMTFGQAAWRIVSYPGDFLGDRAPAPVLAHARTSPRVVWALFDEWDYRLTFVDRPAGLSLPAIDRLRAESIFAAHAVSPGMDTGTSVPSLITGRPLRLGGVSRSAGVPPGVPLFLEAEKRSERFRLDQVPSVFSAARESGYNTALIGWYLPYCRMLNAFVTSCAWWPVPTQFNSTGDSYFEKVRGQTISLVETDTISPFGQSSAVRQKARMAQAYMERATAAVTDSNQDFVFLHVPVPHAPHAYDRATGRFDKKNAPLSGYIDSLSLMDRMLGKLRQDMEARGLWNHTAVILSADHPYRESRGIDGKFDARVPFLVKLPGPDSPAVLEAPLHTIVTAQFVLGILDGTIKNTSDALKWLERHGQDPSAPVPSRGALSVKGRGGEGTAR